MENTDEKASQDVIKQYQDTKNGALQAKKTSGNNANSEKVEFS